MWTGIGVLGLLIVGGVIGALIVRHDAASAKAELRYVEAHLSDASTAAGRDDLQRHLASASSALSGAHAALTLDPALVGARYIPWFGTDISGTAQIIDSTSAAVRSAGPVVQAAGRLQELSSKGHVNLVALAALERAVQHAVVTTKAAATPVGGLWGPVGSADAALTSQASRVARSLVGLQRASSIVGDLLGARGPRRVLLLLENNAEMRDQGMVLSYALLQGSQGTMHLLRRGSIQTIQPTAPVSTPLSPGTLAVFGSDEPNLIWQSINGTANFPTSGALAQAMFQQSTGIRVDEVIGVDVVALADLLKATGPVSVPSVGVVLTNANATTFLLHTLYANLPNENDQLLRRDELSEAGYQVFRTSLSRQPSISALGGSVADAVEGRHLQVWSSNPAVEQEITAAGASGAVDTINPSQTFHVALQSATSAKLDYYTRVNIHYTVTLLDSGGAWVETTVAVRNTAPAGQAPSYQLGPDHINTNVVGQYFGNVYMWFPRGAQVSGGVAESGLELAANSLRINPQSSSSLDKWAFLPARLIGHKLQFRLVPQPRIVPETVTISVTGNQWKPLGTNTWSGILDRTRVVNFPISYVG